MDTYVHARRKFTVWHYFGGSRWKRILMMSSPAGQYALHFIKVWTAAGSSGSLLQNKNEKQTSDSSVEIKKENAILLYFEKPFKQAAIIFCTS